MRPLPTVAEIADILNVQTVLEGSVRRSGDRVRITAQLVDANTGYHIWSGSYQRQLKDIFELQDELARSMVNALRAELGVDRSRPLIAMQTSSLEAYNWFLRGRALMGWSNPRATTQGIEYLEKAVAVDPLNAVRKATTAFVLNFSGDAEVALAKALEALALNPEHEMAIFMLINAYGESGRFAEGQRLLEQLSPVVMERPRTKTQIGLFYAANGDRQRAVEIYRELADDPPPYGMMYLAKLALKVGEVAEAIDMMEREVEINSFIQFWARPLFRHEPAVQNHPRYLALLKRIGLDDESVAELNSKMSFD